MSVKQEDNELSVTLSQSSGGGEEMEEDFDAIEKQMAEIEAEQEKLHVMSDTNQLRTLRSGAPMPTQLTPDEKAEMDSRSCYVGNVDYSVTADDLQGHFHGCGSVTRVTIMCDKFSGHPKGFAYVEFSDVDGMKNALAMDESLLHGRQIKVCPKRTNKPGISTTNRLPRTRGRGNFRGRGGVIIKYMYAGFRPRGRFLRRRPSFGAFP